MYIHYNITKVFMVYWNLKQARNEVGAGGRIQSKPEEGRQGCMTFAT